MKQVVVFIGAVLVVLGLCIGAPAAELQFTLISRGYWQTVGNTLFSPEILPDMLYSGLGGESLPSDYQDLAKEQVRQLAPRLDQVQRDTIANLFDYVEGKTDNAGLVFAELKMLLAELETEFAALPGFPTEYLNQMENRILDLEGEGLPLLQSGYRQVRWSAIGGLALGGVLFLFGVGLILRFGGRGVRGLRRVGSPLLVFGIPGSILFGTAWLVLTPSAVRSLFENSEMTTNPQFLAAGFGPETLNWFADNLQSLYWVSVAPILIVSLVSLGLGILIKLATPPPRSYYD